MESETKSVGVFAGEDTDHTVVVGTGDRAGAQAFAEFENEPFLFLAQQLDILDVDHEAAMATQERLVVARRIDLFHGVVKDKGILLTFIEIMRSDFFD